MVEGKWHSSRLQGEGGGGGEGILRKKMPSPKIVLLPTLLLLVARTNPCHSWEVGRGLPLGCGGTTRSLGPRISTGARTGPRVSSFSFVSLRWDASMECRPSVRTVVRGGLSATTAPTEVPNNETKGDGRVNGRVIGSVAVVAAFAARPFLRSLHNDVPYVVAVMSALAAAGIQAERRTQVGKALSAPLATMMLGLLVANLGLAPFASPSYAFVNAWLVPLAVPLLLFDSDLRRIVRDNPTSLLVAFGLGSVSTVLATLAIYPLIPMGGNWKIASALAARHIGGAVNFVAVAETLKVPGSSVTAAIAADNVVTALYFAFLFAIAPQGMPINDDKDNDNNDNNDDTPPVTVVASEDVLSSDENNDNNQITITPVSLGTSLTTASMLVAGGGLLTRWLLAPGTSSLPLVSLLTVLCATAAPDHFRRLAPTGTALGIWAMQLFFAASGLAGSLALVLREAPATFAFSAGQLTLHFAILYGLLGRLFLPQNTTHTFRELCLASNANVGGPTTAAAMAQAKGWTPLIVPALLIGILGYATATALALTVLAPLLQNLPTTTPARLLAFFRQ